MRTRRARRPFETERRKVATRAILDAMGGARSLWPMDPDEFRRHAHELVDWMADYLRDVGTLPVTPAVAPRRHPPQRFPPLRPHDGEPFDGAVRGLPRADRAGDDPLEPPRLVRLLPRQQQPAVDPGRDAHRDHGRAVHVVGDLARGHRAGAGDDGLAAADARAARGVRRRHPGHRLDRDAGGAADGAGAGDRRRARATQGMDALARRSRCTPRARRTRRWTRR